jgi:hypothetical protein
VTTGGLNVDKEEGELEIDKSTEEAVQASTGGGGIVSPNQVRRGIPALLGPKKAALEASVHRFVVESNSANAHLIPSKIRAAQTSKHTSTFF